MTNHFTSPKYRADIDGLRSVAVLSVVGYHAFPGAIRGGFIGVDIFFVISGYLISTIIIQNLKINRFSLIEFYCRRIRRIFPALALTLLFCLITGWIILLADEYAQLGKHVAGGAGFISNFILWAESGYFDNDADTKPLLHLWSLGIEEQFYIIWPMLLWMIWRKRSRPLMYLCSLTILSFSLNLFTAGNDAVAAFYSPLTRFWELLIGAILAHVIQSRDQHVRTGPLSFDTTHVSCNLLSLLGGILLIIGFLITTEESLFPGWIALFPAVGTVSIIAAGPHGWINRMILSKSLLVWIGLISYPLYLWHWPMISFTRIIQSGQPTRITIFFAVFLSLFLAWLTWKVIERPIRFGNHGRKKACALTIVMFAVGCTGYTVFSLDGLPSRSVVNINPHRATGWGGGIAKKYIRHECGITSQTEKELFAHCIQDTREPPRYALLGDSKAGALYAGIFRTSSENGRWLFIGGNGPHGAPVPTLSKSDIYKEHQKLTEIALEAIIHQDTINTVVLVAAARELLKKGNHRSIARLSESRHYADAFDGLHRTAERIIRSGKNVIIIVDNPTLPDPKDCIERKTSSELLNKLLVPDSNKDCKISISKHLEYSYLYHKLLLEVAEQNPERIKIFETLDVLCNTENNMCGPYKDGHILYSYTDHVSDYAAGLIGEKLNMFLNSQSTDP